MSDAKEKGLLMGLRIFHFDKGFKGLGQKIVALIVSSFSGTKDSNASYCYKRSAICSIKKDRKHYMIGEN